MLALAVPAAETAKARRVTLKVVFIFNAPSFEIRNVDVEVVKSASDSLGLLLIN
jgi:hypothetical protein